MSVTHGYRSRKFEWRFEEGLQRILIENERGRVHSYTVQEIQAVLHTIFHHFSTDYFPLANNVEWLGNATEKMGLGKAILELEGSDVNHAQGSSYLGIVLEESGYFAWNGKHKGIEWRLQSIDFSSEAIVARLKASQHKK